MKSSTSKVKIHRVSRNSSKRRKSKTIQKRSETSTNSTTERSINMRELKDESKISIFPLVEASHRSKSNNSWRRPNRIDPNEFTLDVLEKPKKKKKRKSTLKCWQIGLCVVLSLLLIGGILAAVIYTLTRPKTTNSSDSTTTGTTLSTTTLPSACSAGATSCSSPILYWPQANGCNRSSSNYVYFSCCYRSTTNQLTIRFKLQETVTQWYIDDISLKENSRELLSNGGFESNLTDWTVLLSNNASWTSYADFNPGSAHSGSMYLRSGQNLSPDYILQHVDVTQGQDVNVSFWWFDEGGVSGASDVCEGTIILIP